MIYDDKKVNTIPFEYTMSLIGGKWKMTILFWISNMGTLRYGELKKHVNGITHKVLSTQLKELEKDELIVRVEYPQVPPKVEYSLSTKGETIMPILSNICVWGENNLEETK